MSDFLRELLFESMPMLLAVELIAMVIVIVIHRRRLTSRTRRAVWITLAVCVLLLVLQKVVVTDQEAIEVMVRSMAKAVDDGDVPAIGERIDDGFRVGQVNKQQLISTINQRLQEWQVDSPHVTILAIEVNGDDATVRFRVACELKGASQAEGNVPSYWKLRCVRRGGEWKMVGIEAAEMGPGVFTKQGGMNLMPYLNLQ